MTAFRRAFLFCDDCGNPYDSSTVPGARTIEEVRRDARRDGWTRRRGWDLYFGCKEK